MDSTRIPLNSGANKPFNCFNLPTRATFKLQYKKLKMNDNQKGYNLGNIPFCLGTGNVVLLVT